MTDLERIGQRLVTGFPGTALTPELVQATSSFSAKTLPARTSCGPCALTCKPSSAAKPATTLLS
mgnify:CR=1 FL=1